MKQTIDVFLLLSNSDQILLGQYSSLPEAMEDLKQRPLGGIVSLHIPPINDSTGGNS